MAEVGKTRSLCPECLKILDAVIYEKCGKIYIEKECPEHGTFNDVYWSNSEYYYRAQKYRKDGKGIDNPNNADSKGCPFDCGLCDEHLSSTLLANIDITNRCNMCCPICFANAGKAGYVIEPTREEIKNILIGLSNQKPTRCTSVQFSGGEPTVRDDFPDIVNDARELGFTHVQVATNGKRFANDLEYAKKVRATGLNTIYFQFDGVKERPYIAARGYNALPEKIKAMENMRKANINSIVLVPTLVKGMNDDQVGDIIRFAFENKDIVSAINFQPVSFAGRIDQDKLNEMRITLPDLAKLLEEQTNGEITREDIYPIPYVNAITNFIEAWKKEPQMKATCHEHCGFGTYLFKDGEKIVPITRFVEIEELFSMLEDMSEEIKNGGKMAKAKALFKITRKFPGMIDSSKAPPGLNLKRMLLNVLSNGTASSVVPFHRKALFLGAMHFMDLYNFDIERVKRCSIHYALPNGKVIPFCSYNNLHREKYEKEVGIPLKEWKKRSA